MLAGTVSRQLISWPDPLISLVLQLKSSKALLVSLGHRCINELRGRMQGFSTYALYTKGLTNLSLKVILVYSVYSSLFHSSTHRMQYIDHCTLPQCLSKNASNGRTMDPMGELCDERL